MIVVFGSLIADLVFSVERLPRPGETVACPGLVVVAGGKGANQAVAAARTGAKVRMAGCVGRDPFGELLIGSLRQAQVGVRAVRRIAAATGCAAVCVDADGQNQIVISNGANLEARAAQVGEGLLARRPTVLTQLEVPMRENAAIIRRARAAGAEVVLNAAPAAPVPAAVLRAVDYLIVNEFEAQIVAEALGQRAASSAAAARTLAAQVRKGCIVTLGAKGALAVLGGALWRVGALPVVAVDATAAGDAFVGVFAASLDAGRDPVAALHRASVVGGLACLTMGAQPSLPSAPEIEAWLAHLPPPERLETVRRRRAGRGRPAARRPRS